MEPIQLENWKPKVEDLRHLEFDSQRSAKEVFEELRQRLDSIGMLPDEYFEINMLWKDGQMIPRGADIFCTTDYGESEGVYLDIYLKWYDKENKQSVTRNFATGKTLGESGTDLDRMYLIASAVTKAFHGDREQHTGVKELGEQETGRDRIVCLTPEEQQVFIAALMERREKLLYETDRAEKLLRRMTGSITNYMNTVGERPLHISDHDKASLAIRDGELAAYRELLPRCKETLGVLLREAAGRAGPVGRKLTLETLSAVSSIDPETYLQASRNAVRVGDMERVKSLMERAEQLVDKLPPSYYGEVLREVHTRHRGGVEENQMIHWARETWIAAASTDLLIGAIHDRDYHRIDMLLKKGIRTEDDASRILLCAYQQNDPFLPQFLTRQGMKVALDNYGALNYCVENKDCETAKYLLDSGMNLDKFEKWFESIYKKPLESDTLVTLREHWQASHPREETLNQKPAQERTQNRKPAKHRREER